MSDTKTAIELDRDGKCVACGKKEDGRQRGLCQIDYASFRRKLKKLPKDQRDAFDRFSVDQGMILPDGREKIDPFTEVLSEFQKLISGGISRDLQNPDHILNPNRRTTPNIVGEIEGKEAEIEADRADEPKPPVEPNPKKARKKKRRRS